MFFDQALGIAEKFLPADVRAMVDRARFFAFPKPVRPVFNQAKAAIEADISSVQDDFFVPFGTVAVEWAGDTMNEFVVIFDDIRPPSFGPKQMLLGYGKPRRFCLFKRPSDADVVEVVWGRIENAVYASKEHGNKSVVEQSFLGAGQLDSHKKWHLVSTQWYASDGQATLPGLEFNDNLLSSMTLVAFANAPSRWVFEEMPIGARSTSEPGRKKLRRTHERPIYTLLEPGEIKRRLARLAGNDEESAGKVSPHERRPHWRRFHHEKYQASGLRDSKGILIPATWVGTREVEANGRRYRVCLEV